MRKALVLLGVLFAFAASAREKPDPVKSRVVIKETRNGAQIVITPRDRLSNMIGPGYESHFKVSVSSGSAAGPVDPNRDGTYVVTITYPDSDDPKVSVSVDGVQLVSDYAPRRKKHR